MLIMGELQYEGTVSIGGNRILILGRPFFNCSG